MHVIPRLVTGAAIAVVATSTAAFAGIGDFISGGEAVTDPSAWPWQVRLFDSTDRQSGFCGGSLISDQWVLTAAHCVVDAGETATSVVVGYDSIYQSKLTLVESEKIIANPQYGTEEKGDLALIKLAKPLPDAKPIKIADPATEKALTSPGSKLIVTGWGALWDFKGFEDAMYIRKGRKMVSPRMLLSSGELLSPDQLRQVQIELIPAAECKQSYRAFGQAVDESLDISANEICAGSPSGAKDSCYGDSGGPLVAPTADKSYVQVGIVSWGVQCGNPALPGVYSRISQFTSWIHDTMAQNSKRHRSDGIPFSNKGHRVGFARGERAA